MNKDNTKSKTLRRLKVAGRELPCRVTMGAMVRFKREAGYDVSELDTKNLEDMVRFVWCCVASACRADKVDFDMDVDEFADNLEADDINGFYAGLSDPQKKTTMTPA